MWFLGYICITYCINHDHVRFLSEWKFAAPAGYLFITIGREQWMLDLEIDHMTIIYCLQMWKVCLLQTTAEPLGVVNRTNLYKYFTKKHGQLFGIKTVQSIYLSPFFLFSTHLFWSMLLLWGNLGFWTACCWIFNFFHRNLYF